MDLIADTDILSTFSKISKLSLLQKLFPKSRIYISNKTREELLQAKKLGYKFVVKVVEFKSLKLTQNELIEYQQIKETRKSLSPADIETLVLAKQRNLLMLTNDISLLKEAIKYNVTYFNLPMILRELWKQKTVAKKYVNKLIEQIEKEDRILIVNKEIIFTE